MADHCTEVEVFEPHNQRMNRRHVVAATATTALAGCTGLFESDEHSRLELTVRNDREEPITVEINVVDSEGTTYEERSEQIDSGVVQAVTVRVGTTGRHEVTVTGDGFGGQLAWNAETCAVYEGTVSVNDQQVSVAGECLTQR